MTTSDSTNEPEFTVVISDEERYSIWPTYKDVPWGWRSADVTGSRQACLDHIAKVWNDMRPLSLRREMATTETEGERVS